MPWAPLSDLLRSKGLEGLEQLASAKETPSPTVDHSTNRSYDIAFLLLGASAIMLTIAACCMFCASSSQQRQLIPVQDDDEFEDQDDDFEQIEAPEPTRGTKSKKKSKGKPKRKCKAAELSSDLLEGYKKSMRADV